MLGVKKAKKILLVDDEAGFAELLKDLLEMDGYEVTLAYDGKEGLEKLKTFEPDAIISDIMMPIMDGFEMFRRIKAIPEYASIPFLFISGFQDNRIFEEARRVGVFGILQKPIDLEQIERRLNELIRP